MATAAEIKISFSGDEAREATDAFELQGGEGRSRTIYFWDSPRKGSDGISLPFLDRGVIFRLRLDDRDHGSKRETDMTVRHPQPPPPGARRPRPVARTGRTAPGARKGGPSGRVEKLIRYTAEEIRRLLNRLVWATTPPPPAIVIIQSRWRRTHQTRAQRCHYATRDKRDRESRL
ncbi:hypothetical protein [Streptomyces sp. SID12488]|uniref:hypothetical protein n=1 Tax=Streptomyces sp. SID12488 TaxID=2706040 RepID=UPI0013DA2FE4|nr:hypothetical protein [Streptomyces sp. SID12488]NEA66783.1 hypothetical protein [Streptomyces sp. SID12488]